VRGGHRALTE